MACDKTRWWRWRKDKRDGSRYVTATHVEVTRRDFTCSTSVTGPPFFVRSWDQTNLHDDQLSEVTSACFPAIMLRGNSP